MRKTKRIKIDDKEITVKELTVEEIIRIKDNIGEDTSIAAFFEQTKQILPMITEGLSIDDVKKMAPSEIEQILDAAKDVNSSFFKGAQWLGMDDLLGKLRQALMADFLERLAASVKQDT